MKVDDFYRLLSRMFPQIKPEFCKLLHGSDPTEISLIGLLDMVNNPKFSIMQIQVIEGTTRNVSLKHLSPRIVSPRLEAPEIKKFRIFECPTKSLSEILSTQSELILLLKLTDVTRSIEMIGTLEKEILRYTNSGPTVELCPGKNAHLGDSEQSMVIVLVEKVENSGLECIYAYSKGLLISSIEINKNTTENLRRIHFYIFSQEVNTLNHGWEFVDSSDDDRGDHVDTKVFLGVLNTLKENQIVDSEICDLIRAAYNLKPAFIKFLFHDYESGVFDLISLA